MLSSQPEGLNNTSVRMRPDENKTESLEIKQGGLNPLSIHAKKLFVEQLKTVNRDLLTQALVAAAWDNQSFPRKIDTKLNTLQIALFQNKDNDLVQSCVKQGIKALVETELVEPFIKIVENAVESEIETLNSSFLHFLAKHLNIPIQQTPVVQATIQDGKIYWRVIRDGQVIYDHQQSKGRDTVIFSEDTSWFMNWELFRAFKDSGKRSSSVAITKERFIAEFGDDESALSAAIWDELKAKGILNSKNKLSHGWRIVSNVNVNLRAIDGIPYTTMKATAAKKTALYKKTIETLYKITNNKNNATVVEAIPGATIYRPERSPKKWQGTGLVLNESPETEAYCTRLWDVGAYDELLKHRYSGDEIKKHGEILEYDHIPSTSYLKSKSDIIKEYETEIKKCDTVIAEAKAALKSIPPKPMEKDPQANVKTRKDDTVPEDPRITALKRSIEDNTARKNNLNKSIEAETKALAFTVAIPHKLHAQGDTYLQSAKAQALSAEHPFIKDISVYMYILETRPGDFKLEYFDDFIKALGAFRYLYHTQCKQPVPSVSGEYSIGRVAHTFFQDANTKKKIDKFLREHIKSFVSLKEGDANKSAPKMR